MSVPNPSVVTIPGGIRVKATIEAPPALLNEVIDLQQILSRSLANPNDSSIEAILSASLKANQAQNVGPSSHLAIRSIGRSESGSASTLRTASGLRLLDFTARERRKLERAEQRARLKAARNRTTTLSPSASPVPMSTDAEGFVVPHAFFSPPGHSLSDTSSRTATPLHGSTGVSHRLHNDLRRSRPPSSSARTLPLPHSLTQQSLSRASSASTQRPLSSTQRLEPVARSSSVAGDSVPALRRATRAAPAWLARTTNAPTAHTLHPQVPDTGLGRNMSMGIGMGMGMGGQEWQREGDATRSLRGDNTLHGDASTDKQAQSLDSVGCGQEETLIYPVLPATRAGTGVSAQRSLADLVSQRRAYAGTPVRAVHAHAMAHAAEDMEASSAGAIPTTQDSTAAAHSATANTAIAAASASSLSTTAAAAAAMSAPPTADVHSHTHASASINSNNPIDASAAAAAAAAAASMGFVATPSTPPRAPPRPAPCTSPRPADAPPLVPTPPPRRRTSRGTVPAVDPSLLGAAYADADTLGAEDVGLDSSRENVDAAYDSEPACDGADAVQRSRGRTRPFASSPRGVRSVSSYSGATSTRRTPSASSVRSYAASRTPHTTNKAPYALSRTGTPSSSRSLVQALEESVLAAADCHCRHRCVCGTTPCRCARICVCAIVAASVGAPHSRAPSPMGTPLRQRAPVSAQSLPRPSSSLVRNPYHTRANGHTPSASASPSASNFASSSARPVQLHMADSYHLLHAEETANDGRVVRADVLVGVRAGRGGAIMGRSHSYALSTHSHTPSHMQQHSQPHARVQDTPTATPDVPRVLRLPHAPLPPHYHASHADLQAYPYSGHDELSEDGYGVAAYADAAGAGADQSREALVRGVYAEAEVSEGVLEGGRVAPIAWTPLSTASAPNTVYSIHAMYQQQASQRLQHRRHSSGGDSGGAGMLYGNGDGDGGDGDAAGVFYDHETHAHSRGFPIDVATSVAEQACVGENVAICGDVLGSTRVSPPPLRAVASNGLMDLSNPLLLGGRTLSGHAYSYDSQDETARDGAPYAASVPRRVDVTAESPLVLRDTLPRAAGDSSALAYRAAGNFRPARTTLPPPMPTPGKNSSDFPSHGGSDAADVANCTRAALAWGNDVQGGMDAQLAPPPSQPPTPASQVGKNVVYIPPGFDSSRFRDPFPVSTGMEEGEVRVSNGLSVDASAPSLDAHAPTLADVVPQTPSLAALPLMPSFTPSLAVHDASLALDAAELMITPLVMRRPDTAVQPRRGIARAHRSAPASPAAGHKGSQGAAGDSHDAAAAANMPAGSGRSGHLGTLHTAVAKAAIGESGAAVLPSPVSLVHTVVDPLVAPADPQGIAASDDALVTPTTTPVTTAAARRIPGAPIHPGGGLRGTAEDADAAYCVKELYVATEDALEGPTAPGPILVTPGSTPATTPQIPAARQLRGPPAVPRPCAPSTATGGSAVSSGRRMSVNPPTPVPGRPLRGAVAAVPAAPNAILDAEVARRELKSLLARCLAAFLSADNPLYLEVFSKSYKRVRKHPECCRMWGIEDVSALLQPWAVEATIAEISSVFPQLSRESILTSIERKIMVPTRKRKSAANILAPTAGSSSGYRMNGYYGNEQPQKIPKISRNSANSENPRPVSRSHRLPILPSRSPSGKDKHSAL